jgi:hypothetical protein
MVDYVKMRIYLEASFLKHNILNFIEYPKPCKLTGAIRTMFIADYHHLKFKYYPDFKMLIVQGSLHKFYNSLFNVSPVHIGHREKGFNYTDFAGGQLDDCLSYIEYDLHLDLRRLEIRSIEFGLNLRHSFITEKILDGLHLHQGETFDRVDWYRVARHEHYELKIYDKGHQFGLGYSLIRIEMKYKKKEKMKPIILNYASDLLSNPNLFRSVANAIVKEFYDVLIFSDYTIDLSKLTPKKVNRFKEYSNDIYWKNKDSKRRDTPKKELRQWNALYSENLQEILAVQFLKQSNVLLGKI